MFIVILSIGYISCLFRVMYNWIDDLCIVIYELDRMAQCDISIMFLTTGIDQNGIMQSMLGLTFDEVNVRRVLL